MDWEPGRIRSLHQCYPLLLAFFFADSQSPQKKRARDDDLLRPLGGDTREVPESFEFNEIRDPEVGNAIG